MIKDKINNQIIRVENEVGTCARGLFSRLFKTSKPRILFFPSSGREGASLLRAYYMADALTKRGWEAACVSPLIKQPSRKRIVRCFRPDLLIFQQCRHVLNDGDMAEGIPYVLDTDDADFYLNIPGLVERLERTSKSAAGVICGSQFLEAWHAQHNNNTTVVWTGTPISQNILPKHSDRQGAGRPILTWAQAKPIDYDRELEFVLDLIKSLHQRGVLFKMRFYGVSSEKEVNFLKDRVGNSIETEFMPAMKYDSFLQSLTEVAVGLSPIVSSSPFSRGKSFGKILGYLDAGVPVIASDEADHSLFFNGKNGFISKNFEDWVEVASRWLKNPTERQEVADEAYLDLHNKLSIDAAADLTDIFLRSVIETSRKNTRPEQELHL